MALETPTQHPFENSDKGNLYLALMELALAFNPEANVPDPDTNINDPSLKPFEDTDDGNIYLAIQEVILAIEESQGNKLVYIASLDQASTAAPTPTVLINIFGEVPVWTRDSAGTYTLTITQPMFTDSSRVVMQCNASTIGATISTEIVSATAVRITQFLYDAVTPGKADGLVNVGFTLEIYP